MQYSIEYGINDSSLAPAKQNGTGAAPAEVKLLNIEDSMQQATICIFASRIDQ